MEETKQMDEKPKDITIITSNTRMAEPEAVDAKYLNCRMYPQTRPHIKDYVHVTYKEIQPDYGVKVILNEYNDCEGTIYLAELTRKKQIKSLIRECPIGQTVVAEVLQSDPGFISLSKRNLIQSDQDKYQEWFALSKRLHSILRKVAFRHKVPLPDLCAGLSWPLYEQIDKELDRTDRLVQHPYNILADKDKILSLVGSEPSEANSDANRVNKEYITYLIADHEGLFGAKSYEESLTVQMLSYGMDGVTDLKTTLGHCADLEKKYGTKLDIVTDECPKYTFKFTGPDPDRIKEHMKECLEVLETFRKFGFFAKD